MTGPRFARAWVQANTLVHHELVKALPCQGNNSVSVKDGQVVLNPGPFLGIVKQDLASRGFNLVSMIPAINPALTLFSARYLVKAQTGYRLINDLKLCRYSRWCCWASVRSLPAAAAARRPAPAWASRRRCWCSLRVW